MTAFLPAAVREGIEAAMADAGIAHGLYATAATCGFMVARRATLQDERYISKSFFGHTTKTSAALLWAFGHPFKMCAACTWGVRMLYQSAHCVPRPAEAEMAGDMRLAHHDRPNGARVVEIGGVSLPVATPRAPELVPHVLFYDIPRWVGAICCAESLPRARQHTFGLADFDFLVMKMDIENHLFVIAKSLLICLWSLMCFRSKMHVSEPFLAANCMCCERS
jgi:hypothetical protein